MKNNYLPFYLFFIINLFLFILFFNPILSFALGDPKLVSTINSAFENIEKWILKIINSCCGCSCWNRCFYAKI